MTVCGIFGLFLDRPLSDEHVSLGREGQKALKHRGPDGQGEWIDRQAGVYLGFNRLAIVDPTPRSDQPMVRGDHVLAFNGEIYNFKQLRSEFERTGTSFETTGDAEVLLEAWRRWGPQALDRLDGMFASVVWDGAQAHLAIGPFGEKPLCWAEMEGGVAVASELRPLVEIADAEANVTSDRLTAYLSLGYVPAPDTAFDAIHRFPRASYLQVSNGKAGPTRRYWTPPKPPKPATRPVPLDEAALDNLAGALIDSLRKRLHSDVPMCLFLSGGTDSSLVAALAKVELDRALPCITVAFPGAEEYNEAPLASKIADHLGLEHTIVEAADRPDPGGPEAVLDLFGQPNDNITILLIRQMTELASKLGYKTALTGMGGDEVFYGYQKHAFIGRYRTLYNLPELARVSLGALARAVAGDGKLRHFADLVGVHDHEVYIARKNYPAIDWLRRLPGFDCWARRAFENLDAPFDVTVPRHELEGVMPDSHLPAMDHGSMRSGLELRTPFLSKEVIEAVAAFDPRAFTTFGQKEVLRRLLKRYLPDDLVDHPKRGFRVPMDRFVERCGPHSIDRLDLPAETTQDVFDRVGQANVWARLAVRIILADTFIHQEATR